MMTFNDEAEAPAERQYPYRAGWMSLGCAVLLLSMLGSGGAALLPVGCEKFRDGNLPVGIALLVIGVFGAPLLLVALGVLFVGIREAIRPRLLRVTTGSLILPINLRQNSTAEEEDEHGEKKRVPPAHPEEVPFAAIRWIRREGPPNPGSDKLMIVHDLSKQTLVIEQYMMRTADFNELESVLRTAVPGAFASAPPTTPPVESQET